jgi:hypothetical protein
MPLDFLCLRVEALQIPLASTLYYGAATIEGELKAHVWVKSGERDVVGCEVADEYAQLARFPDDQAVSIGSHNL